MSDSKAMDTVRTCIERGECRPRHRATKDRREWCGGKEGRLLHVYQLLSAEQCAAIPAVSRLAGSYQLRTHGRGLGYVVFLRACIQCGRQDYRTLGRTFCHCGAPLGRKHMYELSRCERCDYEPYSHPVWNGQKWVEVWSPCRCETTRSRPQADQETR